MSDPTNQIPNGSPSGAGAPASGGAPAASAAGGAPDLADAITNRVLSAVQEKLNPVFARLNQAGAFKGGKAAGGDAGTVEPPATGAPAASPSAMTREEFDRETARQRAFTRSVTGTTLSEKQLERMEKAFSAERPDDVATWARGYLEDFGLVKPGNPNSNNPNGISAGSGAPGGSSQNAGGRPGVSDGGAPSRDGQLEHRGAVWNMTQADVDALIRQKGSIAAASKELAQRFREDLKGVKLTMPRPGR